MGGLNDIRDSKAPVQCLVQTRSLHLKWRFREIHGVSGATLSIPRWYSRKTAQIVAWAVKNSEHTKTVRCISNTKTEMWIIQEGFHLHSLMPPSCVGKMGGNSIGSRSPFIRTFTLMKTSPSVQKCLRWTLLETDIYNVLEEEEPHRLPRRLQ